MKKISVFVFVIMMTITSACSAPSQSAPTATATLASATTAFTPIPTLTLIPTFTQIPTATPIPGTIVLDFAAQLCNSKWMNGGQKFAACPPVNADHSAGYAVTLDPASEGLPAGTPVLLTISALNEYSALFLRYPALTVQAGDRFRTTLRCQNNATACDVEFALEYYDANGKYHSPFASWQYKSGDAPINVDYDLSALAGQNVDFVLALRPNNNTPELDTSLWIAPQIFRASK